MNTSSHSTMKKFMDDRFFNHRFFFMQLARKTQDSLHEKKGTVFFLKSCMFMKLTRLEEWKGRIYIFHSFSRRLPYHDHYFRNLLFPCLFRHSSLWPLEWMSFRVEYIVVQTDCFEIGKE